MEKILDTYWVEYLRWWRGKVIDDANPPTVGGFWVWYVRNVLDKDSPNISSVDVDM